MSNFRIDRNLDLVFDWEESMLSISFYSFDSNELNHHFQEKIKQHSSDLLIFNTETDLTNGSFFNDFLNNMKENTSIIVDARKFDISWLKELSMIVNSKFNESKLKEAKSKIFFISSTNDNDFRVLVDYFNNFWHLRSHTSFSSNLDQEFQEDILLQTLKETNKKAKIKI